MKVKEYLIKRIEEMEKELKTLRSQYEGVSYELSRRDNIINEQKKLIDDFQIEREHIKQIITCNIVEDPYCAGRYSIDLLSNEDDFKTLLAILDIKPEDYDNKEVIPDAKATD